MSYATSPASNPYASFGSSVADAAPSERTAFVRKTYTHLAAAIYAFAAIEWAIFSMFDVNGFMERSIGDGSFRTISMVMFGGFVFVSWIANRWAQSDTSVGMQYAGLFLYVLAQAVFFVPLLWMASHFSLQLTEGQAIGVIPAAGVATLVIFGGLTAFVWISGKDFSFLGMWLGIAGMAAFALIIASMIFGFDLGVLFSVGMIAFAAAYIVYDTSNVMHQYRPGQHVAASLALFASVALLFWYILSFLMRMSSRD